MNTQLQGQLGTIIEVHVSDDGQSLTHVASLLVTWAELETLHGMNAASVWCASQMVDQTITAEMIVPHPAWEI